MRLLMKIAIPTAAENAVVRDPKFNEELRALFLKLGAEATYSNTLDGRRFDYVLVDLDDVTQSPWWPNCVPLSQVKPNSAEVAPTLLWPIGFKTAHKSATSRKKRRRR